ncbi:MAG: hypothetical protein RLZZ387_3452 [Chloroflexota bacterium]|jgi:uncharacterized protein YecE (DUF72 family)
MQVNRHFHIGCAVWAYKEWVGELFPPGSKSGELLRLYSRRLTTVEGNTTFYAVPSAETVARWAAETPPDFRFCLKIPQEISHQGPLGGALEATRAFVERVAPLGERLGPFFLQLPPGYRPRQIADLERWLAAWPAELPLAVEVRHLEWYAEPGESALMELLERYGAGRVLMDVRPLDLGPLPGAEEDMRRARDNKPDVPLHPLRTRGPALVRYIGHPDVERNAALLDEWADRVAAWLAEGAEVYFFMHCPTERVSPSLCRALQRRLEGRPGVPPLPWDALDTPEPRQGTLF